LEGTSTGLGRRASRLAWGAIGGVVLFNLGWLLGEALQTGGYSVARHDVSDLGALTAQDPWVVLATQGICGALTILFALFALRPALAVPGRRMAPGPWLLAASLMGLDNLSDFFFRLDCQAADPTCTSAMSSGSRHGTIHVVVGTASGIATLAAPFFLAARMRLVPGWRDMFRPTVIFGFVFLVVLLAYAAVALAGANGGGYLQRAAIVLLSVWVVVLALRVRALARAPAARDSTTARPARST
jgi:hypothetical membrane protein